MLCTKARDGLRIAQYDFLYFHTNKLHMVMAFATGKDLDIQETYCSTCSHTLQAIQFKGIASQKKGLIALLVTKFDYSGYRKLRGL